jgi:hypothetical protein
MVALKDRNSILKKFWDNFGPVPFADMLPEPFFWKKKRMDFL